MCPMSHAFAWQCMTVRTAGARLHRTITAGKWYPAMLSKYTQSAGDQGWTLREARGRV